MGAPMIIGKAHNCNDLLRPSPSDIQPLNREPTNAPARHVLTTKPLDHNKWFIREMSIANKNLIYNIKTVSTFSQSTTTEA